MPRKNTVRENRAALAGLQQLAGPPGAASTRLHGRYATATVGSITLHLFEWEVNFELETFDATAHGERWKVFVAGDQSWTARARGYFVRSTAAYLQAAANLSADPTAVSFTGYQGVTATGTDIVWQGDGFITRANFSAPMAMVTQEIEIQGSGIPADIAIGT